MKKLCLILAIIFAFCGCFAEEPEILNSKPEGSYTNPKIPSFVPESENQEKSFKIFLPLINFTETELNVPDNAEVFGTRVEIPVVLPENYEESSSNNVPAIFWEELITEIQKDYPAFDPEHPGWKASYNFYAADGTAGMLKINYYIDENIITDKAIIGTVENGVITRLSYTNVDFETDEQKIREKARNFLESTTQTKRIFEEGEEFLEEETLFHYHYPSDMLIYCYQLYFYVDMGETKVINNDYGYECIVE